MADQEVPPSCRGAVSRGPAAVSPPCRPQLQRMGLEALPFQRDTEDKGPTVPTGWGHAEGQYLLQTFPLSWLSFSILHCTWLRRPAPFSSSQGFIPSKHLSSQLVPRRIPRRMWASPWLWHEEQELSSSDRTALWCSSRWCSWTDLGSDPVSTNSQ